MRAGPRSATIAAMRPSTQRRLQRLADYAIPSGVAIVLVLSMLDVEVRREDLPSALVVLGLALSIAQGAALRWRRERPELVMAIALFGGLGILVLAPEVVLPLAGFFAVFSLAATRPPRVSLVGLAALLALTAGNFATATVEDTTFAMAVAGGSWALGEAARTRRLAIQQEARRAVAEEQARIARELHDVIAHSVSVIVVQAGAAGDVFDERPDQARSALASIERAGRETLAELRGLLSAVRPGAAEDRTHPQPGLDRVDELAAPLREAGLEVEIRREGDASAIPAGVELAAYRIVQEALTNTLRHGRATRAEVTLRHDADAVELEVRDNGRGAAANGDGGGHGLVGMRERASMYGGTFEAGQAAGGGYRVHARLPLRGKP